MPNRVTGLLIARHETQQVNAWLRADRAAMAVEREIRAAWREFLDLLATYPSGGFIVHQLARRLFHGLPDRIRSRMRDELVAIVKWSARQTGAMMGKTLPTDYLRAASMVRVKNEKPINRLRVGTVLAGLHDWNLLYGNVSELAGLVEEAPVPSSGIVQLAVNALGLQPTDYVQMTESKTQKQEAEEHGISFVPGTSKETQKTINSVMSDIKARGMDVPRIAIASDSRDIPGVAEARDVMLRVNPDELKKLPKTNREMQKRWGVKFAVDPSPAGVIRHELTHAKLSQMSSQEREALFKEAQAIFANSKKWLSARSEASPEEFLAELGSAYLGDHPLPPAAKILAAKLWPKSQPKELSAPTGIIGLARKALGIEPTDYADPFREPARPEMSDERKREIFTHLLFPQPDEDWTNRILALVMQGQTWYQALDASMRAAEYGPDRLANIVATGYALGKSQRDIATDVLPWVDGLRWRGARVARTFGLAVAGRAQREMHEQVDDLTIGFMVRATLDERTRPAHRLRNGTVFYRQPDGSFLSKVPVPGPPGKLLREMPHPPVEGDGSLSWNCR